MLYEGFDTCHNDKHLLKHEFLQNWYGYKVKNWLFKKGQFMIFCYMIKLRKGEYGIVESSAISTVYRMTEETLIKNSKAGKNDKTNSKKIQEIAIDAVFIALTYVFTAFVNVKLPIAANGGLIHLGNIPLFAAAIVFGWKTGMVAGGIGMGLFDMVSGAWATWAPFTLVIVGAMGFAVGKITEKKDSYVRNVIAIGAALVIKVVGYYIAEGILYGNFIAPVSSIPGNVVQVCVAAVIVLPISVRLKKAAERIFDR